MSYAYTLFKDLPKYSKFIFYDGFDERVAQLYFKSGSNRGLPANTDSNMEILGILDDTKILEIIE